MSINNYIGKFSRKDKLTGDQLFWILSRFDDEESLIDFIHDYLINNMYDYRKAFQDNSGKYFILHEKPIKDRISETWFELEENYIFGFTDKVHLIYLLPKTTNNSDKLIYQKDNMQVCIYDLEIDSKKIRYDIVLRKIVNKLKEHKNGIN